MGGRAPPWCLRRKKQSGGDWKVVADMFNADAPPKAPAVQHVLLAAPALNWVDAPPSFPPVMAP